MADAGVTIVPFDALCAEHAALMEAQADDRLNVAEAKRFVKTAAAAGVQIESIADRDAIRSMINYWTATIARMPAEASDVAAHEPTAPEPVARPMLAAFDAAQSPKLADTANPFMGLAAFGSGDAGKYFGREKVVADLLQLVLSSSLVVVSGASGTGKSSLVRAGLVSALRRAPECADWIIATAVPGRDPIASLSAALAPEGAEGGEWAESFRQHVDADPKSAGAIVPARLAGRGLLVVMDQTEELFSLCQPEDRDRAGHALAAIAALPGAHVVLTIRDEYLETERAAKTLPDLDLAQASEFRVPPLQIEDIRAAIMGPAAEVGLVFQDGVVDRIVADVGTDPAALPLLQYALLRLWKKRDGNRITMAVYDAVGGPSTALSNAAQEIYDGLGSTQAKENARVIFQQLVRPSLLYEFVRDRVSRGELERLIPPDSIRTVLTPFVAAALIQVTPGSDRGEDRVEIVHEALIRNWEPLRRWALEVRDSERAFLSLDAQAQRWRDSGRAWGHLMFGRALGDADATLEEYRKRARVDPVFDRRVDRFIKASRSMQRRIYGVLTVAAVVVVIAAIGGFLRISMLNTRDVIASRNAAIEIARVASLTEISASRGEQARSSSVDEDAARQFIQMLVSRGTIAPSELPPSFVGMTAAAVDLPASGHAASYPPDFLGLGAAVEPAVPVAGLVPLDLDHMRVWFDPAGGVPRLIASQYDRSQPARAETSDALFRWPGLAGQPDEVALARAGIGLAHLVDRREVAWGTHGQTAAHGANLIATMLPLGRAAERNAGFGAWPMLQAWMRVNHNPDAARVLFLTGAVPGDGPAGSTIPKYLWKVAVSTDSKGKLVVDAAMLPIAGASGDLPGRTTLKEIARVAGVDFSGLQRVSAASVAAAAAAAAVQPTATPTVVAVNRIYIEARGLSRDAETGIADALRAQSFIVPRIQHVDPCIATPEIRYYFRQDAEAAARASSIAAEAVRTAGLGDGKVNIKRLDPSRYPLAKQGTIELWLCDAGSMTSAL